MPFLTLKVMASLLQLHGPGANIQSDHQGIDALLGDIRRQGLEEGAVADEPVVTEAYFRRGGFVRGGGGYGGFRRGGAGYYGGGFRRAGSVGPGGGFRRGGFIRGY
jgi:hypothetical protein